MGIFGYIPLQKIVALNVF